MNPAIPFPIRLIQAAVILTTFLATAAAFAVDRPPQDPAQQRAWLVGHLVTDMEASVPSTGTRSPRCRASSMP